MSTIPPSSQTVSLQRAIICVERAARVTRSRALRLLRHVAAHQRKKPPYAALLLAVLPACLWISCSAGTAPSGAEVEASMATMVWLDDNVGIVRDSKVHRLLSRIARRLGGAVYGAALETQVGSVDAGEYREFPWQLYVIDSDEPNAFSSGAGVIILTKGLMLRTTSEAELASIIAHEMAHQILGHTREALAATEHTSPAPRFAFSLDDEIAADRLGLKILRVARYDLSHAPQALTIGYRSIDGLVSGIPADWLAVRMAQLHQELQQYPPAYPSTATTREFTRVQAHLARHA